ncbi:MAG: ASKHA domain-containing protein, partial [Gemmatimonadales bacterium]
LEATPSDHRLLGAEELQLGWRLACQARVQHDTVCQVPALMRVPKAATMGVGRLVLLGPNVQKIYLELGEPALHDQRSDHDRLKDALIAEGYGMQANLAVLRELPAILRRADFKVTAVLAGEDLIAVEPGDTSRKSYGVAFDIGTTTVVATLMNLGTGMSEGVVSTLNRQAPSGADVIARISHAMVGAAEREELRVAILNTVNDLLRELYESTGVGRESVYEAMVVGNATMLHLLLGVDPEAIGVSPFIPAFRHQLCLRAGEAGVEIHPNGQVQTLPLIGAYVGADIVAGVLASGLAQDSKLRLLVDVGTNGEIVLGSSRRLLATAAPAGPAFEGGQIRCGMRAADGAIEGVALGEEVSLQVIGGNLRPVGICGSGLVDIVAQLRLAGLLDISGRLLTPEEVPDHPLRDHLIEVDRVRAFRLTNDVYLTQKDIRELQFGKGSIAGGIKVLMDIMGVTADDLDEVLLAGSFGTYINPESARVIGLVPWVPVEKILSVGNAAGEGAKMALLSFREREVACELPAAIEYVELSGRADFNDSFVSVLPFADLEVEARRP